MKLIKLTDKNGQTYGGTQWGENVTHTVKWSGKFCSPGCIHVYDDLLVALFLNHIHANFVDPQAWEAEGEVLASDNGLKFGVASLTTVRRILPLPKITTTQRVAFGILCAKEVYREAAWSTWADNWLAGRDRTADAAAAAAAADADAAAVYAAAAAAAVDALNLPEIAQKAMSFK